MGGTCHSETLKDFLELSVSVSSFTVSLAARHSNASVLDVPTTSIRWPT